MSKLIRQVMMLPRYVRVRVVSAFALTAVVPLLVATYVVTKAAPPSREVPWLCVVMLLCVILALLGLYLNKEIVFGVVDLARIAAEIFRAREGVEVTTTEVVQLERLLNYMDDQLLTTRRLIRRYRETMINQVRQFKLPPLVPTRILVKRLDQELRGAAERRETLGVFAWKAARIADEEVADDTYVPAWLREVLKRSGVALDGIGALEPGCWVGWSHHRDEEHIRKATEMMREMLEGTGDMVAGWCHPADRVTVHQVFDVTRAGRRAR